MCAFLGSVNTAGVPSLGAVQFVKAAAMGVFLCPPRQVSLVAAFDSLINEKPSLVVFVFTSWMCEIETPHVFKHLGAKISKDENGQGREVGILTSTSCSRDRTAPRPLGGSHRDTAHAGLVLSNACPCPPKGVDPRDISFWFLFWKRAVWSPSHKDTCPFGSGPHPHDLIYHLTLLTS